MKLENRIALAAGIVVIDLLVFVIPLTALFVAYILIARPAFVRGWVIKIYTD